MEDEIGRNEDDLARFPRQFVKIMTIMTTLLVVIEIGVGFFCFAFGKRCQTMLPMLIPTSFFGGSGALIFAVSEIGRLVCACLLWSFRFLLAPFLDKTFIMFAPRYFTEAKAKIAAQSVLMSLAIFVTVFTLANVVAGIFYYSLDNPPDLLDFFAPARNGKSVWVVSHVAIAVGIWVFYKWANAAVTRLVAQECSRQPAPAGDTAAE